MVYLRMIPLGLWGGSQDTTTLLAEEGTALMPAGGPGSKSLKKEEGLVLFWKCRGEKKNLKRFEGHQSKMCFDLETEASCL